MFKLNPQKGYSHNLLVDKNLQVLPHLFFIMHKQSSNLNMSLVQFYGSTIEMIDELEECSPILELPSFKERYVSEEEIAFGGMKDILKSHDKITGRNSC